MAERAEIQIRLLEPKDDRTLFSSGDIELDRFFQRFAGQNQFRHHIGTTYIAEAENHIVGFVTVSVGELATQVLPQPLKKKLPTYPIPILRIARLAVDHNFQGQGVGKLLLKAMLELAMELRDRVGCAGVVVDAKQEAVSFYQKLGFTPLEILRGELGDRPVPLPLFLPIRLIAKACL